MAFCRVHRGRITARNTASDSNKWTRWFMGVFLAYCSSWGLLVVWYRKPGCACVLGACCTSFLSHFLPPTRFPSLPLSSSSGSSVRPVLLKGCQCVPSGEGMVDLTAILRCEHSRSCIREHYVSLLAPSSTLDWRDNGKYFRIKTRIWSLCDLIINEILV